LLSLFCQARAASDDQTKTANGAAVAPMPVKKVFQRNKIRLGQVERADAGSTPAARRFVFHVKFPYDPQSPQTTSYFDRLYAQILDALNGAPYALIDDDDELRIKVSWDRSHGKADVEIDPMN
jgi:hypothetical protein